MDAVHHARWPLSNTPLQSGDGSLISHKIEYGLEQSTHSKYRRMRNLRIPLEGAFGCTTPQISLHFPVGNCQAAIPHISSLHVGNKIDPTSVDVMDVIPSPPFRPPLLIFILEHKPLPPGMAQMIHAVDD